MVDDKTRELDWRIGFSYFMVFLCHSMKSLANNPKNISLLQHNLNDFFSVEKITNVCKWLYHSLQLLTTKMATGTLRLIRHFYRSKTMNKYKKAYLQIKGIQNRQKSRIYDHKN